MYAIIFNNVDVFAVRCHSPASRSRPIAACRLPSSRSPLAGRSPHV